jgi:2-polyprenyl-6-methoxyphenol hydroxylase-like FAD-dependent oxidoreductase
MTAVASTELDFDVAIVGYGPVGQAAAALLGRAGHRVGVFERHAELYDLPRAVAFDHEIMRIWQSLGIVDELAGDLQPVAEYTWFGSDGAPIVNMEMPPDANPSGWEAAYLFFQPRLEAALDRTARAVPTVELHRPWIAEALEDRGDHVELRVRGEGASRTIRAAYVIGADGANSFVREAAGIAWDDLGFAESWLTLDVRPHDMAALDHVPTSCQWCDPARPHMHTRNGREHRRWEFMLLPGERPEEFADEARVWRLLSPWMGPADGVLIRHAVYEFRSLLGETMRRGRVLLAGDAAHLMPPFLGQGMCSGVRDAHALAWRLDLVLRGESGEELLDTYTAERRPQNEWIVRFSVEMGRVSCELDPAAAGERDAALREVQLPPPVTLPGLSGGFVGTDGTGDRSPLAGALGVQGKVARGSNEGRLDDVVGRGFVLLAAEGDPRAALTGDQAAYLERLGTRFASLDPGAPGGVRDLDGRLTGWLGDNAVAAVIVRPDFYVFGAAGDPAAVPALVDDLRRQLTKSLEAVHA